MPAPGWPCVVSPPGRTGSQSSGTVSLGIRLSDLKQFERGKNRNKIRGGGGNLQKMSWLRDCLVCF